jgi:cbb3-type cytochrome oxidase maturation protein
MSVIYMLISISIIVAVLFLYAFIRAVRNGQFDDDYTPSVRMLFDDEVLEEKSKTKQVITKKEN